MRSLTAAVSIQVLLLSFSIQKVTSAHGKPVYGIEGKNSLFLLLKNSSAAGLAGHV
jgi:hypothetical protein